MIEELECWNLSFTKEKTETIHTIAARLTKDHSLVTFRVHEGKYEGAYILYIETRHRGTCPGISYKKDDVHRELEM